MRITPVATALAVALALAGCTGAPPPEAEQEPGSTASPTDTPTQAAPTTDLPCGVATSDELAAIFGTDLGAGSVRTSSTITVQEVTWHPSTCVWDVDDLEVDLAIADAAAFESGTLTCMEPLGIGNDVQPVGGIGDQAWWEEDDADEGMLRACTATHVIDIDIDADDGFDARTAAIELMQLALAAVG